MFLSSTYSIGEAIGVVVTFGFVPTLIIVSTAGVISGSPFFSVICPVSGSTSYVVVVTFLPGLPWIVCLVPGSILSSL